MGLVVKILFAPFPSALLWFGVGKSRSHALSGPVLRDTARLSQPYPPIARYGVFGVSTWPIANLGAISPPPFLSISPLESMQSGGAFPPPLQKGYLSDTCAIPYENKVRTCNIPLCDTISKRYCGIRGGISHWAAKHMHKRGGWVLGQESPFPTQA